MNEGTYGIKTTKKSKVIDRCKRCVEVKIAEESVTLLTIPLSMSHVLAFNSQAEELLILVK